MATLALPRQIDRSAAPSRPAPVVARRRGAEDPALAMRAIAERLEQRVLADFFLFASPIVATRRHGEERAMRRLAAHLAAEAQPLHALGAFTVSLELSPDSANALVLPGDVDPALLPPGWADALYSNRLAGAADLAALRHRLRPGGVLVADLPAGGPHATLGRIVGLELVELRDPGCLQGRAWRRAILMRPVGG
jgi:hypothetical protein